MSLISYPIIRQYVWYCKKLNTDYFSKTLPVLYMKQKYYIYYTDTDINILKKVNLHLPTGESCKFENVVYHVRVFTNYDHDDIINKLRKLYKIVYIDVDENLIWKERTIEKPTHSFFDKLISFTSYRNYNKSPSDHIMMIPILQSPIETQIEQPQIETQMEQPQIEAQTEQPLVKTEINNTLNLCDNSDTNTCSEQHKIDMSKIEDYYSAPEVKSTEIITAEIINGTGIKKHQEVFAEDDFIIIYTNEADL